MNWHFFHSTLSQKGITIFTPFDVTRIFGISLVATTFLLHRYSKKKFIIHLKRGLYCLSDTHVDHLLLANKIYTPSYISLEFALSYYGILPETTYEITSITTKPTRRFVVLENIFSYKSVQKKTFTGYAPVKHDQNVVLMAEPEKAFVDYIYFKTRIKSTPSDRLDLSKLKKKMVIVYAALFNNKLVHDCTRFF